MKIRPVDMLTNLKNWPAWDYKGYKLNENEAEPIIKALDNYIWHDIEKEGTPKESGWYLIKIYEPHYGGYVILGDLVSAIRYVVIYHKEGKEDDIFKSKGITDAEFLSWRKIIDEVEE